MKRTWILTVAAAALVAGTWTGEAAAGRGNIKNRVAYRQSQTYPWHGGYYDVAWGMPVAVVVPPTAETKTRWSWGVGGTTVTPIQHQFERNYPGPGSFNRTWFQPTPRWPSNTDQFGDYYIRGPW